MKSRLVASALLVGLAVLACSPLHDLDAASRGSSGALGRGGASGSSGGTSSGGSGVSLELLCKDGALNGAETDVDCGG
ncbi:MAG TPA: hypothetical protein VFQ35_23630, partial [Polyangiaceae bacterium]|nr:hypothetical protein [Polyangiaceae bacterium]